MLKTVIIVALLAGALATPTKTCDGICTADKACQIGKCNLLNSNPSSTCAYTNMLTGGYQITEAGGPCKCQPDGTCADWGAPNPTCKTQYADNKGCIVGYDNAETYVQFGDLCALSQAAMDAIDAAEDGNLTCTDGQCVIGGCFKTADQAKMQNLADSGFDLSEFEFRWINPADPLFFEQNGISALILERTAGQKNVTVEVAHTPLPEAFKFKVLGDAASLTFTAKVDGGVQTGFTLLIKIPDNSDNLPVVQYGVPQISLTDTVKMTVLEGSFYVVFLPVIAKDVASDSRVLKLKAQPEDTTSTTPTLGATAIALSIGNTLIVETVTCPSTAHIGVRSQVKDATATMVEDIDFGNQNSAAFNFIWSRTDLAKDTEVTLTWICASPSAPLGLVDGLNYIDTVFSQKFKTGDLPAAKGLADYNDPADFELFFAQLNQNTSLFKTVDILNLLTAASKKWGLLAADNTTWTDPLTVSADTQRGVTKLLGLTAAPLEKLAAGTVECDAIEANLTGILFNMMDYADLSAAGQALVARFLAIGVSYTEPCFADVSTSSTKFGQQQASSRRSAASKQTAQALTPAAKKTAELTARAKQLKDFEGVLEREVRRIAETPGKVYLFDSVYANGTKTGCYTGCVVRNPALKKSLDGASKDHPICNLANNGDALSLKGVDENIKKNEAKYPKDAVVGFVKFAGANQCNYELAKDATLKYGGSFHVFFFDGAKLPPKGATPPKKKAAASKGASAKMHYMRARSMGVQQVNTTTKDGNWAVYIKPAGFVFTASQCTLRDQTTNVTATPTNIYTGADGCEVASNSPGAGPSVSRTIYVLPKSAPQAPTAPTAKSATRAALSLFALLAVMVLFAIL